MASGPRSEKSLRRQWKHLIKRTWHNLLALNDTPHRIAWGASIGFVISWLPIVGLQMAVSAFVCWILRGNVLASIPPVWLSNPITMIPMYWVENQLGALIYGRAIDFKYMGEIWDKIANELGVIDGTVYLFTELIDVTIAMFIGGFIIGIINAAICYFPVRKFVARYQASRAQRREQWCEKVKSNPAISTAETE